VHRVDGIVCRRPKPEAEVHSAVGRIERNESLPGEAQHMAPAMKRGGHRRGVTGLLFGGSPNNRAIPWPTDHRLVLPIVVPDALPDGFAVGWVKGDYARVRLGTNHHDEAIVFKDRRTAHTEKRRGNVPIGGSVALPNQFA